MSLFPVDPSPRFRSWGVWGLMGLVFSGCGGVQAPAIMSTDPLQTRTLLMSEVDALYDGSSGSEFLMPFQNQSSEPQTLKVKSIGCSCFSVMLGDQKLKPGDPIELAPAQEVVLKLLSKRPIIPKTSDYQYTLEYVVADQKEPIPLDCRGTVRSVADVTIAPELLTTSFGRQAEPQTIPFEITRTSRAKQALQTAPTITGWPPNAEATLPVAKGPATEQNGFWSQTWTASVRVSPPKESHVTDQATALTVACADIPPTKSRLLIRQNYGISVPALVHLSRVTSGVPASRRIQVTSRDQQPFRILECQGGSTVSAKIENPEAASRHWIDLTATPTEAGDWDQLVTLRTDHADAPALEFHVKAVVVSQTP